MQSFRSLGHVRFWRWRPKDFEQWGSASRTMHGTMLLASSTFRNMRRVRRRLALYFVHVETWVNFRDVRHDRRLSRKKTFFRPNVQHRVWLKYMQGVACRRKLKPVYATKVTDDHRQTKQALKLRKCMVRCAKQRCILEGSNVLSNK